MGQSFQTVSHSHLKKLLDLAANNPSNSGSQLGVQCRYFTTLFKETMQGGWYCMVTMVTYIAPYYCTYMLGNSSQIYLLIIC